MKGKKVTAINQSILIKRVTNYEKEDNEISNDMLDNQYLPLGATIPVIQSTRQLSSARAFCIRANNFLKIKNIILILNIKLHHYPELNQQLKKPESKKP
jgi:hypothetical protein